MTVAYIGLGSNLGDRKDFIHKALKMLAETENIEVSHVSDLIETAPLGGANQPAYLNAVAQIKTGLTAKDLHKALLNIETSFGRTRGENGSTSSPSRAKSREWSSRTIDLDILLFGDGIINSPDLIIPHPQMHLRSFVLKGLCQLDAELLHPVIKEQMKELANRLNNMDFVLNPGLPQLVNIAGIIGVGKTTLAKKLSELLSCKCVLEPYDKNPFLPDVYAGKKELALNSQLFFLTSRIIQLNCNALGNGQITISDYVFDKELIYAQLLLDTEQLDLYKKIYPPLSAEVTLPVLVIYLTDSVENCLERIHRRNRPYEQKIQPQFLASLSRSHEELFAGWKKSPVIRLSMSEFNFMQEGNIKHLANQIRSYIAI
jgi:deoxyguanosine kinase